ncbi:hypothetical protein AYI69_g9050 [Smittium culicis]|uniref:Uncharacterized protein n=2 Tax=Smittium culicis TaxID=133412 RepID=A0A1R1XFE9_9FUNG|nr:hypothetical protein AYI69_g9050 [Smittium culicis]
MVVPYYIRFEEMKASSQNSIDPVFRNGIVHTATSVNHDLNYDPEDDKRAFNKNNINTVVGIRNLRKVAYDFLEELIPLGMANQRSTFEAQGILNSVIERR